MYLCTCNNCGKVFEDTNPGPASIDYNLSGYSFPLLPDIIDKEDGEIVQGCNSCQTDDYLVDNINPNAVQDQFLKANAK